MARSFLLHLPRSWHARLNSKSSGKEEQKIMVGWRICARVTGALLVTLVITFLCSCVFAVDFKTKYFTCKFWIQFAVPMSCMLLHRCIFQNLLMCQVWVSRCFKQGYLERLLDGLLLVHGESTLWYLAQTCTFSRFVSGILLISAMCLPSVLVHAGPCCQGYSWLETPRWITRHGCSIRHVLWNAWMSYPQASKACSQHCRLSDIEIRFALRCSLSKTLWCRKNFTSQRFCLQGAPADYWRPPSSHAPAVNGYQTLLDPPRSCFVQRCESMRMATMSSCSSCTCSLFETDTYLQYFDVFCSILQSTRYSLRLTLLLPGWFVMSPTGWTKSCKTWMQTQLRWTQPLKLRVDLRQGSWQSLAGVQGTQGTQGTAQIRTLASRVGGVQCCVVPSCCGLYEQEVPRIIICRDSIDEGKKILLTSSP